MLKRIAASATRSRSFSWLVGLLERMDPERRDLLRILTYHRVAACDPGSPLPPGVSVPPDDFAEQMRYLRSSCHVVSIPELIHALGTGSGLPRRAVLITFDDGYRDFRTHAWPVMKALGLPVALFVPTAFPDQPGLSFWWDRLHHALASTARRDALETPVGPLGLATPGDRQDAYRRLRARAKRLPHAEAMEWVASICGELGVSSPPAAILGWNEIRELAAEGVTIGSHTRTHPLLTRVSLEEARAEVMGSFRDLERELGTAAPILAYPAGAFDEALVTMLAGEGLALGFTTVRGVNPLRTAHPLKLRRINVGQRTSLALMRAQLTGWSVGLNRLHPLVEPGEPSPA